MMRVKLDQKSCKNRNVGLSMSEISIPPGQNEKYSHNYLEAIEII
jgi:hypothetical protein